MRRASILPDSSALMRLFARRAAGVEDGLYARGRSGKAGEHAGYGQAAVERSRDALECRLEMRGLSSAVG
jgi:hypothetical protein